MRVNAGWSQEVCSIFVQRENVAPRTTLVRAKWCEWSSAEWCTCYAPGPVGAEPLSGVVRLRISMVCVCPRKACPAWLGFDDGRGRWQVRRSAEKRRWPRDSRPQRNGSSRSSLKFSHSADGSRNLMRKQSWSLARMRCRGSVGCLLQKPASDRDQSLVALSQPQDAQ